jgi:hypothetical protein
MAIFCRVAALVAATVGTVVTAAAPADAVTAFTVKGTQIDHPAPYPEQLLPKIFANDAVTRIDYPAAILGMDASIAVATAGIVNAVQNAVGPVVVAGFSQGAVAVAHAKQVLMSLPPQQRPLPSNLSFITIGDPAGPGGILGVLPFRIPILDLSPITAPATPYHSVIVNGEYDGWADLPDRAWNLVSLLNAALGIPYVHGHYETVPGGLDISTVPAANITTTINSLGGHTTQYLIPTAQLPLVAPLRDIGIPEPIVAAIEKPLKAIVDAGYVRNDSTPAAPAAVPRPAPAVATPARVSPVAPDPPPAAVSAPLPQRSRARVPAREPAAAATTRSGNEPAATNERAVKTVSRQSHSARRPAA